MSLTRNFLFATFAFATASLCHAGLYLKAGALYTKPSDLSISNATAFKASLKNNVGVTGALGYKLSVFRIEAEVQHVSNGTDANETSGTALAGVVRTTGSVKETSGFGNAYFDFPSFFGLAPYVGAGLGYAKVDLENLGLTRNGASVVQYSGSESVFGYQGMLGVQFHLFGQATLNAGFRMVKKQDVDVRDVVANARQTLALGTNRVFEIGVAIGF
jgi:opacity protein-like surface antigen